jgi:hypothetical protein
LDRHNDSRISVSLDQVLGLLGLKEVELHILKQRVAALEAELTEATKPEAPQ